LEAVAGVWTGSLALLADACQMLPDTGASATAFLAPPQRYSCHSPAPRWRG
jgi:Co/Zn/Cd efflux system component